MLLNSLLSKNTEKNDATLHHVFLYKFERYSIMILVVRFVNKSLITTVGPRFSITSGVEVEKDKKRS